LFECGGQATFSKKEKPSSSGLRINGQISTVRFRKGGDGSLETLMIVLFFIGTGYAIISLAVGDWLGFEFHAGELPFLSPTVIATFLTVFGGIGYMLLHETGWPALPVAAVSLLGGLAVSTAVLFLVVIPLHAAQKGTALSAKAMIGLEAEVITAIEGMRLGEIVYLQGGTRHSAPAKASEGAFIPQGSAVRIVGETAGTFVVESVPASHILH
jgi:membrane-bound ClpP family serine protease